MASKKTWLVVVTMVLVFGMTIVENLNAQTDSRLNGTWIATSDEIELGLMLNNGNYEQSNVNRKSQRQSFIRGTYTANNGRITFRPTQTMYIGTSATEIGLVSGRWYTVTEPEFRTTMRNFQLSLGFSEDVINLRMELFFSPQTHNYSIVSNSLILTFTFSGETATIVYTSK